MKTHSPKSIRVRSARIVAGLPLFDIAYGPDPDRDERHGSARGIIAIGDKAHGGLALGAVAMGGLAAGGIAVGGRSMGLLSVDVQKGRKRKDR